MNYVPGTIALAALTPARKIAARIRADGQSGHLVFAALAFAGMLLAGVGCVTSNPPAGTITDVHGRPQTLFGQEDRRGTVLVFIERACPISNGYAPEINRLIGRYSGFAFYFVQVDPDLTNAEAQQHATDFTLRAPVIIDRNHELVKLAQARVTPEAAVFSPAGQLLYRGRIDDKIAGFGKVRSEPTHRDLRDVLEAISLNQPVPIDRTTAIGCYIQDFARSKAH